MLKTVNSVAVYLRISREDGETEDTLLTHRTIAERYMKERNYSYYIYEELISGTKDINERTALLNAIRDINKDLYDAFFVIDIGRIGRESEFTHMVARVLSENDIPIITPERIYDLNGDDRMMFDMLTLYSSQEYRQIMKRMKRGKLEGVRRGEWIQGKPPLGYKRNVLTKKLEIVEHEAEIVRFIFTLAKEGYGIPSIVKRLSAFTTRDGKSFNISSVNKILSNTTYTGTLTYNAKNKKGKIIESIVSYNSHEPIIPLDFFNIVQTAIKGRISGDLNLRNRAKGECISILKDLLFCAECGLKMGIRRDSKQKDKIFVNRCKCGNKGITEERLIDEFWDELSRVEKELRKSFKEAMENPSSVSRDTLVNSIQELNQKVAEYNEELAGLRKALIRKVFTEEEYFQDKAKIDKELATIKSSLNELNRELNLIDTQTITNEYEARTKWLNDVKKIADSYEGRFYRTAKQIRNAKSPIIKPENIAEVNRILKLVIDKVFYRRSNEETILYPDGYMDTEKGTFLDLKISPK